MDNKKQLEVVLGEKEAAEVVKLLENYNKYTKKFKTKINAMLKPRGYQVKTGIQFTEFQEMGENINGSDQQTTTDP